MREGLIRHNPSRDVALRHRPTAGDSEGEEVQAPSRDELATLLDLDWLELLRCVVLLHRSDSGVTGKRIVGGVGELPSDPQEGLDQRVATFLAPDQHEDRRMGVA
jgi:hypothetical protein